MKTRSFTLIFKNIIDATGSFRIYPGLIVVTLVVLNNDLRPNTDQRTLEGFSSDFSWVTVEVAGLENLR